jgi:signal transduction histidine kinase
MPGPRIISIRPPSRIDRLMSRQSLRYGLSLAAAIVPLLIATFIRSTNFAEIYHALLFIAIVIPAGFAGLGPGLLTTLLLCLANFFFRPQHLDAADLRLLAMEGALISWIGGTLRRARRRANDQLAANLRLEQQVLEIGDDERERIGHDLHDGLGQHLTGISLLSETTAQQVESGQKPDPANVETITRLVSEAVRITRDLAKTLSPMTLEKDGLLAALEELSDTASSLFGIECSCELDGQPLLLSRARSLHVFRIVQEAVNNSVRHGKAKNVHINLSGGKKSMVVMITDNGSGLSAKTSANPGIGLRIMEYRARILGALLTIERASAAGGTIVTCTCPLDHEPNEN